jgi:[ribosomal protein S5]-alanine N-acetyltransferase
MIRIRLASLDDAAALSSLYQANWPHLAPFEPVRDDDFLTVEGQRKRMAEAVAGHQAGTGYRYVILEDDTIVGMISLVPIERGPLQSANLGYWLDQAATGRGIATQAAALVMEIAFGELGLHRLQAGTLLDNYRSQRVLERSGFEKIGVARKLLFIAGKWQDHLLFQRLADDPAA